MLLCQLEVAGSSHRGCVHDVFGCRSPVDQKTAHVESSVRSHKAARSLRVKYRDDASLPSSGIAGLIAGLASLFMR